MDKNANAMTAKEASDYLGCSDYTIKEKARLGEIPHYKVGNRYRFRREALEKWITDQESNS